MNQAVANRLLRMDRTIEAVDGKLDEVLRLLRPIASGEIPVDAQADVAARILGQLEGPDSAVNLNRSSGLRRRVTLTLSIYRVTASGSLGTRVATGYSSMVQGLRSQKFVNVYRGTTSRANVPILRALHDHRVLSGRQAPSRIGDGVEPWNCSG